MGDGRATFFGKGKGKERLRRFGLGFRRAHVMVAVVEIAPEVSALLAASVAVIVTVGTVVSVLTVNAEVAAFAFPAVSVIAPLLPATEIVAALLGAHVSVYLAGLGKH